MPALRNKTHCYFTASWKHAGFIH